MGYKLVPLELDEAFQRFKELADKKKEIFEDDIRTIIETVSVDQPTVYELKHLKVLVETGKSPRADVGVLHKDEVLQASGTGDGPVDACYKTLDKILNMDLKLLDYSIRSITVGKDAQGEVTVLVRSPKGMERRGRGVSTDVIEASVRAYLDAVNKMSVIHEREPLPYV